MKTRNRASEALLLQTPCFFRKLDARILPQQLFQFVDSRGQEFIFVINQFKGPVPFLIFRRKNAETLKQGAIDAALASERSIVDVETLKKINADIITSINEVVKIHEEGSQKRIEAQEELAKIETELKDALLKAGSR